MKVLRTVLKTIISEEDIARKPKYEIGDYMEVYAGTNEGHRFYIKDLRYNADYSTYEYLGKFSFYEDWKYESMITLIRKVGREV